MFVSWHHPTFTTADERGGEDGSGDGCPVAHEGERREVRVWSDLLRTHLHPWSIHLLSEPVHGSADEPFDVFKWVQLW